MRSLFSIVVVVLFLSYGCKNEEEVLPIPPARDETESETPPDINEGENKPDVDDDADFFRYGKFLNMPYRILYPRGYDSTKVYPLHIFLHGIGERGSDNEKHLSIGSSYFLQDSIRNRYPAFIIYPQCPTSNYWFDDNMAELIKRLADTLQIQLSIDKKRISLGGFSMGGYGTFEIVGRYPGYFESALSISGAGDENRAAAMAKSRWQIFAGQMDDVVPSFQTKKIAEAIKEAGASVYFILYPNADHGTTWVRAFMEPTLFYRLFSTYETQAAPDQD